MPFWGMISGSLLSLLMSTIQSRRKLIVILLLAVAVAGAVIRWRADPASTLHDVGTLLMVMWVPIIGNVIAWAIRKLRRPVVEASSFGPANAFRADLSVSLTLRESQLPVRNGALPSGEYRAALVLDKEGFNARWFIPPGQALVPGQASTVEVELLSPAVALPRFASDTPFRVLTGDSFIGDGVVREVLHAQPALPDAPPA